MQDFFCVKQRNFFALFEHFAQKYPYFSKSGAHREIFSLFFCKFDGFYEKIGKNEKARKRKTRRQAKTRKKTPHKGGVFSSVYTGNARELSTRHLRRSAAKLGSTVLCFLRFFTAFRMTNGGLWGCFWNERNTGLG